MVALRYWKELLAGLAIAALAILLAIRTGERDAARNGWEAEQAAHAGTVANYRTATEQARRADAENKARVEAERRALNERLSDDYANQITAVRERYARLLRDQAAADPGGGGSAAVPGTGAAAGGADAAAAQDRLPAADALTATEQALQLQALQQWVRDQTEVEVNR